MKKIVLLGATGSIGQSTLHLVKNNPGIFEIVGASSHSNFEKFAKTETALKIPFLLDTKKLGNSQDSDRGFLDFLQKTKPDIVINAVVGFAGLKFSAEILRQGIPLALANKESLVAGGDWLLGISKEYNTPIIPVDSEHSAIFEVLADGNIKKHTSKVLADSEDLHGTKLADGVLADGDNFHNIAVLAEGNIKSNLKNRTIKYKKFHRILLTCSGGPFFGKTKNELKNITPEQALKHPTWDMGAKISIDSATLANKCLEFFEAMHFFEARPNQIEIVIHPQSIVHSMVEFEDGSILAQMAPPNMELPIGMALNYPQKNNYQLPRQDFAGLHLSFEHPDPATFTLLETLAYAATHMQNLPTVFNAANEVAVAAFLAKKIGFLDIFEVVDRVVRESEILVLGDFESILAMDREARERAEDLIKKFQIPKK